MQFLANDNVHIYTATWDSEQEHYHRITPVTITASAMTLAHAHQQQTTRMTTRISATGSRDDSSCYTNTSKLTG